NYRQAQQLLNQLLSEPNTDPEYEKLFIARAFEAQAKCAEKLKDQDAFNNWMYQWYLMYPQLIPYSGRKVNIRLYLSGTEDPEVVKRLKACNINWVTKNDIPSVQVYVIFTQNGDKKNISYQVLDATGNMLVPQQGFHWKNADAAGTELAYRLFDIGGNIPPPEA